jgi:hypothetical protein
VAAVFVPAHLDGKPGTLPLSEVLAIAHGAGIPVLVDAAGRIYPLDKFRSYTRDGADLVAFGAKYLGALNASGILCGRADLVKAATLHGFIGFETTAWEKSFGRPLKLDRQTIVAVVTALQEWFETDHDARLAGYEQRGSGFGLATDYGSDTANSTGTTVTSGAAGTKGSYAQLTASCNEVSYLIVMVNKGSATATDYQLVDIAIGGAGSEQIILPNLRSSQTSSAGHLVPCLYGYPVKIPAGTRIAARIAFGQASKTAQISCIGVA